VGQLLRREGRGALGEEKITWSELDERKWRGSKRERVKAERKKRRVLLGKKKRRKKEEKREEKNQNLSHTGRNGLRKNKKGRLICPEAGGHGMRGTENRGNGASGNQGIESAWSCGDVGKQLPPSVSQVQKKKKTGQKKEKKKRRGHRTARRKERKLIKRQYTGNK